MAALVFPNARDAFLNKNLGWLADDFEVFLTDDSTPPPSNLLENVSDLTGVLGDAPITGRTMPGDGVAAAADVAVPGVAAAATVSRVFIAATSSGLLVYGTDIHSDGTSIERVSDGNDIVVHWHQGSGRIFRI